MPTSRREFRAQNRECQRRAEGSPPYAGGGRYCAQSEILRRARCPHRAVAGSFNFAKGIVIPHKPSVDAVGAVIDRPSPRCSTLAPLAKGSWHGEAVTEGLSSRRSACFGVVCRMIDVPAAGCPQPAANSGRRTESASSSARFGMAQIEKDGLAPVLWL